MELLGWESELVILWENRDINALSRESQILGFQTSYHVFPKIVLTNFLYDFFLEVDCQYDKCKGFERIEEFLRDRKSLDISLFEFAPSDARGSLVISFLDVFSDCDFNRTRLVLKYLWFNQIGDIEALKKKFIPEELIPILQLKYILKKELIFFSKDKPYHITLAFDLIRAKTSLEEFALLQTGVLLSINFRAIDYFACYIFNKKSNFSNLIQEMKDFFRPIINNIPRIAKKNKTNPTPIEVDFKGGWKYNFLID
ncbi:hypothetical protein [Cognataquiflexum aquatile]|uniref:hypothetical protein n=1 Tax=Cognataquiflexum aquatile TaxID=2249427 RepID=UPI0018E567D6|nr:hypothetical protein [Cognataquiflexum aquatile]